MQPEINAGPCKTATVRRKLLSNGEKYPNIANIIGETIVYTKKISAKFNMTLLFIYRKSFPAAAEHNLNCLKYG